MQVERCSSCTSKPQWFVYATTALCNSLILLTEQNLQKYRSRTAPRSGNSLTNMAATGENKYVLCGAAFRGCSTGLSAFTPTPDACETADSTFAWRALRRPYPQVPNKKVHSFSSGMGVTTPPWRCGSIVGNVFHTPTPPSTTTTISSAPSTRARESVSS